MVLRYYGGTAARAGPLTDASTATPTTPNTPNTSFTSFNFFHFPFLPPHRNTFHAGPRGAARKRRKSGSRTNGTTTTIGTTTTRTRNGCFGNGPRRRCRRWNCTNVNFPGSFKLWRASVQGSTKSSTPKTCVGRTTNLIGCVCGCSSCARTSCRWSRRNLLPCARPRAKPCRPPVKVRHSWYTYPWYMYSYYHYEMFILIQL